MTKASHNLLSSINFYTGIIRRRIKTLNFTSHLAFTSFHTTKNEKNSFSYLDEHLISRKQDYSTSKCQLKTSNSDSSHSNNRNNNQHQTKIKTDNSSEAEPLLSVQIQIEKYSKKRTLESALCADEILKQIIQQERNDIVESKHTEEQLQATTNLFIQVLHCWSKCLDDHQSPIQAEQLLSKMFQRHNSYFPSLGYAQEITRPSVDCFACVMNTWANSNRDEAPQRTEEILRWMELLMQQQQRSDSTSQAQSLHALTPIYNILIKAWANSRHVDAAQRAEDVLKRMGKLNRPSVTPNVVSFDITIKAWSVSTLPNAALRAQHILNLMEHLPFENVQPTKHTYWHVMRAWLRTHLHEPALPYRIEHLLKRMLSRFSITNNDSSRNKNETNNNSIDPQFVNLAMYAWSISTLPEATTNAKDVFYGLMSKRNAKSFFYYMRTWARSHKKNSPFEVFAILELLLNDDEVKPQLSHFHLVLSTILYSNEDSEKEQLLKMAFKTFIYLLQQSSSALKPNTLTFRLLIQICLKFIHNEEKLKQVLILLLQQSLYSKNIQYYQLFRFLKKKIDRKKYQEMYHTIKEKRKQKLQANIDEVVVDCTNLIDFLFDKK